jgi:hypothetical protein
MAFSGIWLLFLSLLVGAGALVMLAALFFPLLHAVNPMLLEV